MAITLPYPTIDGLVASGAQMQADLNVLLAAANLAFNKDGSTPPTANIPMAGFNFTGLADAVGLTSAVTLNQFKLSTIVSAKLFGVVGDAVTNDTTAFTTAVSAAVSAGALALTSPTYVGAARPTLRGVQLLGNKPVIYDRGGVLGKAVVNRRGRDLGQKVLGRAYLFRFWAYLSQFGTAGFANIKMYVDSVTAGYVGPILQTLFGGVAGVGTVANNAISGTTIEQWRTGTGGFAASGKALSDWIAAPTEVLYIAFGINTPYFGNSPTDFATSLDAALATIRASRDVTTTSVVVVLPVASRDGGAMSIEGGWKRDEYFVYSLRELCEPLVDKYGICLFDPTVATPEADVDVAGINTQNWLDSNGVHPQFGNKYFVAGEVFDAICPSSMRSVATATDATATVTPATGFTLPGLENMRAIKRRELVVTDGYVAMTTPAALTVGQVIATIPASVNPSVYIRRVDLVLYNAGTWETIRGEIDNSAFAIKSGQVSVMAPTRVYLIGQWSTT